MLLYSEPADMMPAGVTAIAAFVPLACLPSKLHLPAALQGAAIARKSEQHPTPPTTWPLRAARWRGVMAQSAAAFTSRRTGTLGGAVVGRCVGWPLAASTLGGAVGGCVGWPLAASTLGGAVGGCVG